ncbi:hypothetical protein KY290_036491 [Solanum tuberosum]|uniref:Uncharacterized protein n=1 Tax=Solanum tuberosum TaxID=4113 RepID=A0ABQ7TSV2_SOLTU|nr:hypothetical protein KY289_035996 [Solanum tuberosum]KAH0639209.1 hypothetical protein KY285_035795 [Solanum tuberosum]KAH0737786.1 hypothetical protein KY290_036491 [Solanum tuberosum]
MASALFSAPTFKSLGPLNNKPTHSSIFLNKLIALKSINKKIQNLAVKVELKPSIVIRLSTQLIVFLERFVFFKFQRENVAKQVTSQNGISPSKAGDVKAKEYIRLLKSNDPIDSNTGYGKLIFKLKYSNSK